MEFFRVAIAVIFGIIMLVLAARTKNQPNRQRALGLLAVGMFALAGYNLGFALGQTWQWMAIIAIAALIAAVVFYLFSWRGGEVRARQDEWMRRLAEKRKQLDAQRQQKSEEQSADAEKTSGQ